jgi:hypothetical protein
MFEEEVEVQVGSLAKLAEEILNFSSERSRLLHRGEMTALFHLRPPLNIRVGLLSQ